MWFDPCVARWVDAVVQAVLAVHKEWWSHAKWMHERAAECHSIAVLNTEKLP